MAQIILNALTTLNLGTHLDPMFTELYNRWSRATFSGTLLTGLKINTDTAGVGKLLIEESNGWALETRITASGGVGFRVSYTPTTGTFSAGYFVYNGAVVGTIGCTSTATSFNTTSDERLKTRIEDSAESGSRIDAIRVRSFEWKANAQRVTHGFIAQELQSVAPEAVTVGGEDPLTQAWTVDPSKLVPLIICELQHLRARLARLEGVA